MDRTEMIDLIVQTVLEFSTSLGDKPVGELGETTQLFGPAGLLDSFGLVSVVLDVEQQVNDRLNRSLALTDDRAMSQKRSPFRTIGSLADYILLLISEPGD
jgi:acyl carrier protein